MPKLNKLLESKIADIKAKYQFDNDVCKQLILNQQSFHKKYTEIYDPTAIALNEMQTLINEGYVFNISQYNSVSNLAGYLKIKLMKPKKLLESELADIAKSVEEEYRQSLNNSIECEIEALLKSASEEARAAAVAKADSEATALHEQLKKLLMTGL